MTAEDARVWDFALRVHRFLFIIFGLNADGDFAERVNAFGDGVDVELEQRVRNFDDVVNGFVRGVHGTRTHRSEDMNFSIGSFEADGGGWHTHRAARDLQTVEIKNIARTIKLIGDERFEVGIHDNFFAVGEFFETGKGFIEFDFIERVPISARRLRSA